MSRSDGYEYDDETYSTVRDDEMIRDEEPYSAERDIEPYSAELDIERQNEELRAQLAAYSEEVELLNEHLEHSREDNEYLSHKIYRIENDLAEERIENASREHFLLRQNTPGLDNFRHVTGATRSRVSFYGVSDFNSTRTSPDTTRTDSVFEVTRPDSVFDLHPTFSKDLEDEVDLDTTVRTLRANSVTELSHDHHINSVDSNRTLQRRSMSYHDMSDIQDKRSSDQGYSLQRYHSYHAAGIMDQGYDYDEEVGYFDDELVPSSYYLEEQGSSEECEGCKEADIKVQDLEGQISYLDEAIEDKDKFIENLEFDIEELKTELRSLKLDKDIGEYELTQKVEFSKEKLKTTESCLKQKDQAYMDLLERFVSLERSFEEINTKYKCKVRESSTLSDKLSTAEFDLMLAEERLQKQNCKRNLLESVSVESSSSGTSSPDNSNPNSKHRSYNPPPYERRSSMSNFERCGLDQQPLSLRSSGSSVDLSLWDIEEEETERMENLNKTRREAEKHAELQHMLTDTQVVSAYQLYRITKELADLSEEEVKENVRGNADTM